MTIQEKITVIILNVTGYRFPKHEGWFCRESKSREFLRALGIRAVICNLNAKD